MKNLFSIASFLCIGLLTFGIVAAGSNSSSGTLPKVLHMTPVYAPSFLELIVDGMAMLMFAKLPDLVTGVSWLGYPVYMLALYGSIVMAGPLSRYFFLSLTTLLWRFSMDMDSLNAQVKDSMQLSNASEKSKKDPLSETLKKNASKKQSDPLADTLSSEEIQKQKKLTPPSEA